AVGIVLPDRRHAFFAALVFDGFQFDRVDRHRVSAEVENSRLMDEILDLGQGATVPNLAHAVRDVQYRLGTQRFNRTHKADQRVCKRVGRAMRASHIVKGAVTQVLQAAGNTGGRVIFHGGNADDFAEAVG